MPEAGVSGTLLPQSGPRYLVGVCYTRRYSFRNGTSRHELKKVAGPFFSRKLGVLTHKFRFDGLVDHKMNDCFGDAHIRRGDALVEAQDALETTDYMFFSSPHFIKEKNKIVERFFSF